MGTLSAYMRDIEEDWFTTSGYNTNGTKKLLGWERYFQANNRAPLSPIAITLWAILIFASFYAPKHLRPPNDSETPKEIRIVK
jgi:hypothetical protein